MKWFFLIIFFSALNIPLFSQTRVGVVSNGKGDSVQAIITRIPPVSDYPFHSTEIESKYERMDRPDIIRLEMAFSYLKDGTVFKRKFELPGKKYSLLYFQDKESEPDGEALTESFIVVNKKGRPTDLNLLFSRRDSVGSPLPNIRQWRLLDKGRKLVFLYISERNLYPKKQRLDKIYRLNRKGQYVWYKEIEYEPQVYDDSKLSDPQYNIWDGQEKVIRSERVKLYKEKRRSTK